MARPKKEASAKTESKNVTIGKLIIWKRGYDQNTGKEKFKPQECTFGSKREYEDFLTNPQGYEIREVVELPSGWLTPDEFYQSKTKK